MFYTGCGQKRRRVSAGVIQKVYYNCPFSATETGDCRADFVMVLF